MRSRRPVASVLALCSALGACSFVSVRSAPRRDSDGRYRCASYALPTGDLLVLTPVAGVATMGAFVGYMFTPLEQEPSKLPHIGLGLATIAALSSSIYGYSAINLCHGRQRELEAAEDARTRKDARARKDAERREAAGQDVRVHAWQLTLSAQQSARNGDCANVRALDAEVRALDAGFHAAAFGHDVAIARCLAAPTSQ